MNAELWTKYTEAAAAERKAKARLDAMLTAKAEALLAHLAAESALSTARFDLLRQDGGEHGKPLPDAMQWNGSVWPPATQGQFTCGDVVTISDMPTLKEKL